MIESSRWLTMSDGVRLDASIVAPAGPAPPGGWPALLLVHGHGEDGSKATCLPRARRNAGQGYLCLCYSVRGQGGSEGLSFHLGAREIFDLQEVVAFARRELPVDSARIGVCGGSQGGWHAWMAAAHTDVATVVSENIFVDYAEFAVPSGALSTWFFLRTMRRRVMSAGLQDQARAWAIAGDWDRLRANLSPYSPRWFADRIRCPVMVVHGWHDVGMPSNDLIAMFEALQVPKRLILGGGGHDGQDAEHAAAVRTELVDRWLAHWLKGEESGILAEPPLTVAVRPGWEHTGLTRLDAGGTLSLFLRHGGTLSVDPPEDATPNANVNHQPRTPAYTLEVALHRDLAGCDDAWPREEVRFDGPPLETELVLRGIPRFRLHVLPERPWYQVHAELWDVAPDGATTLVTRGHCGAQHGPCAGHLCLDIEGRAVAYRVGAGHHLRVVVADQQPAYAIPVFRPWRARLYHEQGRASHVVLPIA